MAFRTACLEAVGGFDPRFRTAGDDVDLCWRLQNAAGRSASTRGHGMAHRRIPRAPTGDNRSATAGPRRCWSASGPEKYNDVGHVRWTGRMYGSGLPYVLGCGGPACITASGRGAVPVAVRAGADAAGLPAADAGVASDDRDAPGDRDVERRLEPVTLGRPLCLAAFLPSVAQACLGGARARFPATLGGRRDWRAAS